MTVTMTTPKTKSGAKLAGQVYTRKQLIALNPHLQNTFDQLGVRSNVIPGTQMRRYRRKDLEAASSASNIPVTLSKPSTRIVMLSAQEEDRQGDLYRLLTKQKVITDFLFMPQVGELATYIEQQACDLIFMHYSIGRQVIENMCKMMRSVSPEVYLFVLKPEGASRRWLQIADEELIASPQQAFETVISRLGIAA